ncbi:MAG TPA: hypothetical protein VNC40_03970 [Gaiellaceae bacterium]|nr:hypothetical protein [Gaiellaceae bacterium]
MNAPLAPSPLPHRLEVIAPDPECAALLLQYAAPAFPAELVTGVPLMVRLQPPQSEPRWVIEFLSLVARWLESAPLPCANVLYGGRGYLIRAPLDLEQIVGPAVDVATS